MCKKIIVSSILMVFLVSFSHAQKWYYYSMHEKMAITDTSVNTIELNKADEVFNRVLLSRPNDSMALYYHFFSNCLRYFYNQTSIQKEEQKKLDKSLRILDSIYKGKCEIQIVGMFYFLLCQQTNTEVNFQKELFALVDSVKLKCTENPRLFFIETFAKVKYKQLTTEELNKQVAVYIDKYGNYKVLEALKPNWGEKQLKELVKINTK